jgi:DNA-directed RNA polymerase subunit M/transcription elongation factor TFIIS
MPIKRVQIEVDECTCERCGNVWLAELRQDARGNWAASTPLVCSKCKSAYWNRPRLAEQVRKSKKK